MLPKPRASHWQGRECRRRYAESKSAHDSDGVPSVSWKDHTSAGPRWRGQGRGSRRSCPSLPSKCVLSVLGNQMLLVKRKDEECCETVPEEKPTVINPLPKIPNPAQAPAQRQSLGLFAQTRSWNKSSGLSDGSKKRAGFKMASRSLGTRTAVSGSAPGAEPPLDRQIRHQVCARYRAWSWWREPVLQGGKNGLWGLALHRNWASWVD